MSDRLTVTFNGITPLLPMTAAGKPPADADKWLALLPDVSKVRGPWGDRIPHTLAPHVACVIVPDEAVDPLNSDKTPKLIFRSKTFGQRLYRLYTLDYESLTINSADPSDRELHPKISNLKGPVPQTADEAMDLNWVASLDDMGLKGAGVFRDDLLLGDRPNETWRTLKPKPPLGLLGTVVLDHGDLKLNDVARGLHAPHDPVVFEFRKGPKGTVVHSQAQVLNIQLESEVRKDTCLLEFNGPGGGFRQIGLLPIDGRYEISIFNLELETILEVGSGASPGDGSDPDFVVSYLLSENWYSFDPKVALPYPFATGPAVGGRRIDCNPARFSGV